MKRTSDEGIALIKSFEGFEPKSYKCPAGVWTIGYGHTKGVRSGQQCTEQEAEEWLRADLAEAENAVNEMGADLSQNRFDALVSFVFNVGTGAFNSSTLRQKVQAYPDNPTIRDEFEKWVYSGGKVLPGLVSRRLKEADTYFNVV